MDVIITPAEGGTVWRLTDLLGRSMGSITESASHQFAICPAGHASETMAGIQQGVYASLDAALAEIEKHTRGVCRRNPEVVADFRRPEFCVSACSRATIHLSVYPPHLHR
jgi:hypothetical protein